MDFKNTRISFSRPLTSYDKVRRLIAAVIRNRPLHLDRKRIGARQYLDIGCGPNPHADFVNLDYGWRPHIDICWDVTKGIPLPDKVMAGIFSEHCFEHLPFQSMDFVLAECHRLLRPGGSIRIIVPDGELYLTRYSQIIRGTKDLTLPYAQDDVVDGVYCPIMSVNRIFRAHGHLYIYDFDLLRMMLEKNGFVRVKRESFKTGRDPKLLIDTASREIESLYVEASTPGAQGRLDPATHEAA